MEINNSLHLSRVQNYVIIISHILINVRDFYFRGDEVDEMERLNLVENVIP